MTALRTCHFQNINPSLSSHSSYEDLFASLIDTGYLLPSSVRGITPESLKTALLESSSSYPNLTEEEEEERKRQCIKNLVKDRCEYQGFDVDFEFASFELRIMGLRSIITAPWKKNKEKYNEYKSYVEFAIKFVKSNVQFVRIVQANWQVVNPINYYITFEAYDPADAQITKTYQTKTYQTRLVRKVPVQNSVVDIFRLKSPPSPAPQCQDQDEGPSFYEPMDCGMC